MGERATWAAVERLAESLSDRDRAVLTDVRKVRVLTSQQIERLHFADLTGMHRDRTRRRVLERLVSLQLLTTLERRIGGVRAGSAGLVFALGPAGQRLLALDADHEGSRARQPSTPTERFLAHNLVVAEMYVGLVETTRADGVDLATFQAEPACWWKDSEGEWIKPDAYAVLSAGEIEDSWAIEVDQATESLPTLRRKLMSYLNLVANGEHGPNGGPLPKVLVTVPNERRQSAVLGLCQGLPGPAAQLFAVTTHEHGVALMRQALTE